MRCISCFIAGRFISLPLLPSSLRAGSGSYPSLIMCSLHTFSGVSIDSPSLACSSVETLQYATAILFDMLILCYGITKWIQPVYPHLCRFRLAFLLDAGIEVFAFLSIPSGEILLITT